MWTGIWRELRYLLSEKWDLCLVTLAPARGAFVATPSVEEAKQVFAVRRMLESEMTRAFVRQVTPKQIKSL